MSDIIKIKEEYLNKLKDNLDLNTVNHLKSELFGKNGKISNELYKSGGKIKCYDPHAMTNAKNVLPDLDYCNTVYDACKGSNVLIIATEWNEFRALDLNKIKELMNNPVIFDLRNIYNKEEVKDLGIEYYGVGK